jgi:hypothetical protein
MTRPSRYLIRMLAFLVVVAAGLFLIRGELERFFYANPFLNGLIIGILALGILYTLRQVFVLGPEVQWIEHYKRDRSVSGRAPRLLAPMVTMIGEREGRRLRLTAATMRTLLDSIGIRLDETREISRYMIALLVFLGLLGTFWGLLETVDAIVKVIRGLFVAPGSGGQDLAKIFEDFKNGLVGTLGGASTAFSTSLFGLGGSLIVGFLDLQSGQAQNRFYTDLEDWLSGMTRISVLPTESSGDSFESVSSYLQALLEHTATTMDELSQTIVKGEAERAKASESVGALAERLGLLVEQLHTQQALLARLADTQIELKPILGRLSEEQSFGRQELVTALRTEFKNLANRIAEVQLQIRPYLDQMTKDNALGRQELVREMRSETEILAQAIATLAGQRDRRELDARTGTKQK